MFNPQHLQAVTPVPNYDDGQIDHHLLIFNIPIPHHAIVTHHQMHQFTLPYHIQLAIHQLATHTANGYGYGVSDKLYHAIINLVIALDIADSTSKIHEDNGELWSFVENSAMEQLMSALMLCPTINVNTPPFENLDIEEQEEICGVFYSNIMTLGFEINLAEQLSKQYIIPYYAVKSSDGLLVLSSVKVEQYLNGHVILNVYLGGLPYA